MQTITEQIKNNTFSQYHLLYGEERYMVRYYRKCLIGRLSVEGDEMNRTYFQGQEIKPSEIAEVGQVLPFLAPQRLIVVQDSGFFKSANDMVDYLKDFPASTYVVFVEREADKRSRLYKWIAKNGCVTECKAQNETKLKQWITGYMKRAEKAISVRTMEELIERVGTDMEILCNEMDKLISYTGERKTVEWEDVAAICSGTIVSKIFELLDATAQGERERALSLYADLLANKESPMSILYLFSRHINILLQFKELSGKNLRKDEMARKMGIPPFTLSKYGKQADLFKKKQLLSMLELRVKYEESFKNGRLGDQLAVEMFLIQALTNC